MPDIDTSTLGLHRRLVPKSQADAMMDRANWSTFCRVISADEVAAVMEQIRTAERRPK